MIVLFLISSPERGNTHKRKPVIDDLFIDFIGDDKDIFRKSDLRNLFQILLRISASGRIRRAIEDQGLRLGSNRLDRDPPAVILKSFFFCVSRITGSGIGQFDHRRIGDPVGSRNDHLVPLIKEGLGQIVEGVLASAGDQDLGPFDRSDGYLSETSG